MAKKLTVFLIKGIVNAKVQRYQRASHLHGITTEGEGQSSRGLSVHWERIWSLSCGPLLRNMRCTLEPFGSTPDSQRQEVDQKQKRAN